MSTRSNPATAPSAPNYTGPFITVAILFGIFGFLTVLNNTLVAKLETVFNLSHGAAELATTAWFFAYLIFSVPAAKVIEKVGYKNTMVISLFVMVVGALLFLPAANLLSFPLTLFAIFVLATGVTGLQTSANPYVSILGPERSAPARLNLAQAINSCGSLVAPWIAAHFILTNPGSTASAATTAHMLQGPYIAIAVALLVLGFAVMMLHLPAVVMASEPSPGAETGPVLERNIWLDRHVVLGMVGIFFYVGLEIALASITIQFSLAQGVSSVDAAGNMLVLFYVLMMAGRLVGSAMMKWIKAQHLLVILGLAGTALLLISMSSHGMSAVWALVMCGITCSIMYPTIFALGVAELGPLTSKGSGVLTIGNVGGAVIPLLFGLLSVAIGQHYANAHNLPYIRGGAADSVGIQYALVIPIIAYLYVTFYGAWGYKPRKRI